MCTDRLSFRLVIIHLLLSKVLPERQVLLRCSNAVRTEAAGRSGFGKYATHIWRRNCIDDVRQRGLVECEDLLVRLVSGTWAVEKRWICSLLLRALNSEETSTISAFGERADDVLGFVLVWVEIVLALASQVLLRGQFIGYRGFDRTFLCSMLVCLNTISIAM